MTRRPKSHGHWGSRESLSMRQQKTGVLKTLLFRSLSYLRLWLED